MQLDGKHLVGQFYQQRLSPGLFSRNHRQLESVVIHVVQLHSKYFLNHFQQLRISLILLPSNHRQLKPVDILIVQLDITLELFNQHCLRRCLLPSYHQLEPVDIYIVHCECNYLLDRLPQPRLFHV